MKTLNTAVIFLVFLSGYGCSPATTVPGTLIGEWRTVVPKYADRSLVITQDQIIFGVGDGNVDVRRIRSVEEKPTENHTLYTIYYANPGEPKYRLVLLYEDSDGGVIRMKNQEHIEWTKGGI